MTFSHELARVNAAEQVYREFGPSFRQPVSEIVLKCNNISPMLSRIGPRQDQPRRHRNPAGKNRARLRSAPARTAYSRDVDAVLVSQGFRDLVDDARGVLTEATSTARARTRSFTGAICPGDDETYRRPVDRLRDRFPERPRTFV